MKNPDQAHCTAERCVRRGAIGPFDEFANLLFACLALDLYFEGDFFESLVFVPEVVEVFAAAVEPAAHLFFQRIYFEVEDAGGPSPLRKMTEPESRQKGMAGAHAFAEPGAVRVFVRNELLIPDFGFSRAVL